MVDDEDIVAAMGFCQVGSALRSFLSLWWNLRELVLSAASGDGVWGRTAPSNLVGCFSLGAFPLLSSGKSSSPAGNLLSASAPRRNRRLHYDLFGSGRGTSTLNLQIEFFSSAQRRWRGCAVPKGFCLLEDFSYRQDSPG